MSAKSRPKLRIAIVGAGNLAGTLAPALHRAGYAIEEIVSRGGRASLRQARRLAREVSASVVVLDARHGEKNISINGDVVWFCVPDGAIAVAARALAGATTRKVKDWKGKVALHSSGALTSDELAVLRGHGTAVASVHPLMTFVRGSRPLLAGVPFAIEGDPKAVRSAREIVLNLGGRPFNIRKAHKEAYHTWGMFASPLLTALLVAGEKVALAAGVDRSAARKRMLPILRQTLANYEALGAPGGFSGPLVRGDVAIVERHLKALRRLPAAQQVYVALMNLALTSLPAKNRAALRKVLR